jgi:hypothetical protein
MAEPRYLSGDAAGIQEFLDKFDVSAFILGSKEERIYLKLT